MALDRILVAIDFSPESEAALEQAMAVAGRTGASIELLWVEERAPASALVYGSAIAALDQMQPGQQAEADSKLGALAGRAAARGIQVTHRVQPGHVDEVIVARAEEIDAQLVVTGTRGRTGLKRFLLGSVAEKVVRTSHTNVLVARGRVSSFRRVLMATDFSPASEKALSLATDLAAPDAELDLFHTWQYPPGTHGVSTAAPLPGDPLAALRDQIIDGNARRGEALCRRLGHGDQTVRFVQDYGPPAAAIQTQLEEHDYDLVALGTHGYRGFRRFLLGSVAEATVRHAPCSVLVAHAGDVPAAQAVPATGTLQPA